MSKQPQAVTFVKDKQGPHGSQKIWRREDGSYLLSSSAHHRLAPASAMNVMDDMEWLARVFSGQAVHEDLDMVSETAVFESDENGKITNFEELAKIFAPESHEGALGAAGYEIKGVKQ